MHPEAGSCPPTPPRLQVPNSSAEQRLLLPPDVFTSHVQFFSLLHITRINLCSPTTTFDRDHWIKIPQISPHSTNPRLSWARLLLQPQLRCRFTRHVAKDRPTLESTPLMRLGGWLRLEIGGGEISSAACAVAPAAVVQQWAVVPWWMWSGRRIPTLCCTAVVRWWWWSPVRSSMVLVSTMFLRYVQLSLSRRSSLLIFLPQAFYSERLGIQQLIERILFVCLLCVLHSILRLI